MQDEAIFFYFETMFRTFCLIVSQWRAQDTTSHILIPVVRGTRLSFHCFHVKRHPTCYVHFAIAIETLRHSGKTKRFFRNCAFILFATARRPVFHCRTRVDPRTLEISLKLSTIRSNVRPSSRYRVPGASHGSGVIYLRERTIRRKEMCYMSAIARLESESSCQMAITRVCTNWHRWLLLHNLWARHQDYGIQYRRSSIEKPHNRPPRVDIRQPGISIDARDLPVTSSRLMTHSLGDLQRRGLVMQGI